MVAGSNPAGIANKSMAYDFAGKAISTFPASEIQPLCFLTGSMRAPPVPRARLHDRAPVSPLSTLPLIAVISVIVLLPTFLLTASVGCLQPHESLHKLQS